MKGQEYVLSLSYGKDSIACLGAIEQLELPLDRIVHAVHDFEKRFDAEEKGFVPADRKFRWKMLDRPTEKGGEQE